MDVPLRIDDGVHLADAGARNLASWIAAAVMDGAGG
jgi:hypothetical protein